MNYPLSYPFKKWRKNVNKTAAQTPLIVEDVMPLTDSANDLNNRVEALENAPAGGSRVIASLENVNLKDVAANVLTWASGKTAANTAPSSVVVTMAANDTYVDNSTAFSLLLDGESFGSPIADYTLFNYITYLTATQNLVISPVSNIGISNAAVKNTGDYSLPVTQGTLNDFRVNIYILGDTI